MSENDIIAGYVKENFPEILMYHGFISYKLRVLSQEVTEPLKKDLEKTPSFLQKVFRIKK